MVRHGVPRTLALAYLREARRASMTCVHGRWSTDPVRAGVGLRQGTLAVPVLFHWVLQECMDVLHRPLFSKALTHLSWAATSSA